MRRWIKIELFFIGVVVASSVHAQILDLKTAVREAQKNSPVLQRAQANVEEARWKKTESYSGFLPTLTGDINYLLDKKFVRFNTATGTINQVVPSTQFLLTGSFPVFDGFTNFNRLRSTSHLYDAAQNDYEWTAFVTEMQTTLLFYHSLAAKNLMDVAYQNVHTIEDHYKDIQSLLHVGIATKFDVLRVEVQMDEANAEVLRATDEYEFSKIRLAKTMGRQEEARIPEGTFPNLKPSMIEGLDAQQNNRKDLIALSEQNQSMRSLEKVNGRFWVPKLSLYGQLQGYNNVNDEFSDWDVYRRAYQVGVNLHWNIFDGMTSIAKAKQARATALASQNNVLSASLKANEDVQIWKRKFQYFCKLLEVKTAESEKSQEAVRLAKESVRAGTKTNSDLLDAELDLFKSRSDVLNVRMGMVEALINLQLATGQKFYNFDS